MADHGFSERRACRLIGSAGRRGNMSRFAERTMLSAGEHLYAPSCEGMGTIAARAASKAQSNKH